MLGFKGLSIKSDQHQLSHNNITAEFREKVRRITKMITKEKIKCFDLLSNSPDYLFKKMYGVKSGEFACGY